MKPGSSWLSEPSIQACCREQIGLVIRLHSWRCALPRVKALLSSDLLQIQPPFDLRHEQAKVSSRPTGPDA
jgi:hypothetical protein